MFEISAVGTAACPGAYAFLQDRREDYSIPMEFSNKKSWCAGNRNKAHFYHE
jgi:hypothetical protein